MDTKPEKKKYAFLNEGKEGVLLQYYRCDPVPDVGITRNNNAKCKNRFNFNGSEKLKI